MEKKNKKAGPGTVKTGRNVTIKDLAGELGLSITTISRALSGYSDVGEKTRKRVEDAASRLGYRPNRNAQRLVTRRTHNIGWVQPDNERKFLDPHFVEVMAGVLRGARALNYDIVMTSATADHEMATYDRYVKDNSVDGFIVDLPREGDPRIDYLLEADRPFVVHGRESRHPRYGWVDVDNYGNFYRLARLLAANGHRKIAFINGDERFIYAHSRRRAVEDALNDFGIGTGGLRVYNSLHPMGEVGFKLTTEALRDGEVTALLYSSILMAIEGHNAVVRAGRTVEKDIAIATMDDVLHYLDIDHVADSLTFVRSSLQDAGLALVEEISRQCDGHNEPSGTLVPSTFHVLPDWDASSLELPVPEERAGEY
ncbi:LacI family DNA-binding transcriptional regulator [Paradevosia shaoguanensis]|uniref:LacI family DNA-binding transcriptional regulator n=1 Tax=Paradevosia shaoguanensis TaxID=1335043 RepID=UPI000455C670|nr:Transcriptional regulator AglR, LacI family [Devosia sp. DBB001]